MMNKKQTSYRSIWKYALILPVLAILLFFNSALQTKAEPSNEMNNVQQAPAKTQVKPVATIQQAPPQKAQNNPVASKDAKEIFNHVEEMPQYPGGEAALFKFLSDNIKYPKEAQEKGIQGSVILRFIIKSDGSVDNVEVKKSLDPILDKEAVRAVQTMPKWIPGKQNGNAVDVYFFLPINYNLQGYTSKPDTKKYPAIDSNQAVSTIIQIDGKVVSEEEWKNFDPTTIEAVSVIKALNPVRKILLITTKKNK